MYRLLIVDDERIARESTYGLLATQEDLELELLTADSAVRAVSILEKERVDIAIMDINMPQMTGLELYSVVRKNWPMCKVIFLTGYSEFDYVYQVHKHARYVLKADREEVLLEAVKESIREIENEMIIQRASELDPDLKQRDAAQRANVVITEMIDGYIRTEDLNNEMLRNVNVQIDCRQPVYVLMVRCEEIAGLPFQQSQSVSVKIYKLLQKYFEKNNRFLAVFYRKINLLIMVQPEETVSKETMVSRLASISSIFLNALQLNTEVDAAVLVADCPMMMKEVIQSFTRLYDAVLQVEKGDIQIGQIPASSDGESSEERSRDQLVSMISHLELDSEGLNRGELLHAIQQFRRYSRGAEDMHDLFFIEMYQRLSAVLLRMVRKQDTAASEFGGLGLADLYNLSLYYNWEQAFSRMEDIAEKVFSLQERMHSEQEGNLVSRMKRYIERHLDEGPSLVALADHYHFSREYLLRVFKKEEGVTILQYINDLKMEKAQDMLKNSDMQVKEIASILGFSSTAYFIRFFRTKTGSSPAAYRTQK